MKEGGESADFCSFPEIQEQIDDLAAMSREYEQQEALRMTQNTNNTSSAGHGSSRQSEPYINELIPVDPARARRREQDQRAGR